MEVLHLAEPQAGEQVRDDNSGSTENVGEELSGMTIDPL